MLELVKDSNQNLYVLKKKLLGCEELHQQLTEQLESVESKRNAVNQGYSKITRHLNLEEKVKQRIRTLAEMVRQREDEIQGLERRKGDLCTLLNELKQDSEGNEEMAKLLEVHNSVASELDALKQSHEGLSESIKQIEVKLKEQENCPVETRTKSSHKEITREIRKVEVEITQRDKELRTKEQAKTKLQKELENSKKELESAVKRNKTLGKSTNLNPPKPPKVTIKFEEPQASPSRLSKSLKTPMSPGRASTSSRRRKAKKPADEEEKRVRVIRDVEKTLQIGETAALFDALKAFGLAGQGVASKLVELNRAQFK